MRCSIHLTQKPVCTCIHLTQKTVGVFFSAPQLNQNNNCRGSRHDSSLRHRWRNKPWKLVPAKSIFIFILRPRSGASPAGYWAWLSGGCERWRLNRCRASRSGSATPFRRVATSCLDLGRACGRRRPCERPVGPGAKRHQHRSGTI